MNTEKEIIYSILNTIRNAEHNNDETVTERLLRAILHEYRGYFIRKYYKNGLTLSDEVFQEIPLQLTEVRPREFECEIPKLIRGEREYGFYLQKECIDIPVLRSSEYNGARHNYLEKDNPRAKTSGNRLILFIGNKNQNTMDETSEKAFVIQSFVEDVLNSDQVPSVKAEFFGVLHNPSDDPNYDWEVDSFPFPSESLYELKTQILVKEFGIMNQSKKDEIANGRGDNVRYHDNENLNQQG